jgi:hypothetical protein
MPFIGRAGGQTAGDIARGAEYSGGMGVAGRSNRQIARDLVVTLNTVKSHIHHVYGKLGVESRVQAVSRARELHIL